MPNGLSDEGLKIAGDQYYANYNRYPFHLYMNFEFYEEEDLGNILYSDSKFVPLLYSRNQDEFVDMSKVSDVSESARVSVYDFINSSQKVVALVDCENADPYALCATIQGMDPEAREKISKVILFDDVHAASAWKHLKKFVGVPVEYILVHRLKEQKSLVDMSLAIQACRNFFIDSVDSFLLISSDSDFWALISQLPEARFLVLVEHNKCSYDLKVKLIESNIFYAYLDSFYSGKSDQIKRGVLREEIQEKLRLDINVKDLLSQAVKDGRMNLSVSEEKNFYEKFLKTLKLQVAEDGSLQIVMKQS